MKFKELNIWLLSLLSMVKIADLKKDILQSGLPTEIQVSNLLKQDNWIVINQYPYIDEKTQKIRTLDIQSVKSFENGKICHLFIECKKSADHQWIFYTSSGEPESMSILFRFFDHLARELSRQKVTEMEGPLYSVHPNLVDSKIGIISYIPFKKKDDFNTAKNQILSAMSSRKLYANEERIIYPVIVFDGDIYEVQITGKDVALNKVDYVKFLSSMISQITPILIDVVTLGYFPSYLNLINKELGPSHSYSELVALFKKELRDLQEKSKST